jgi:hypothetical protein
MADPGDVGITPGLYVPPSRIAREERMSQTIKESPAAVGEATEARVECGATAGAPS